MLVSKEKSRGGNHAFFKIIDFQLIWKKKCHSLFCILKRFLELARIDCDRKMRGNTYNFHFAF